MLFLLGHHGELLDFLQGLFVDDLVLWNELLFLLERLRLLKELNFFVFEASIGIEGVGETVKVVRLRRSISRGSRRQHVRTSTFSDALSDLFQSLLDDLVLFLQLRSLFQIGQSGSELVLALKTFASEEKSFRILRFNS